MPRPSDIETLIRAGRWLDARRKIQRELRADPENHWLVGRLSLTYYERRQYADALRYSTRAVQLAPRCPLAQWDLAGTLQMLGRHEESAAIYRRLIRRGVNRIASGTCGEGVPRARGLVADCHFRLAGCLQSLGRQSLAQRHYAKHIGMRGPGCLSVYSLRQVRTRMAQARSSGAV